jgi:anti-sigma-K factor RskA
VTSTPCPHGLDTGAYVLGALHDDEHRAFERHLAGCEACRREVTELRMAAAMLPLAADQVSPPDALRERIMVTVRQEAAAQQATRAGPAAATAPAAAAPAAAAPAATAPAARAARRTWWSRLRMPAIAPLPAAVAACVVLALGVAGGVLLSAGDDFREVDAQVALNGASGTLRIEDDGDARLTLRDMPAPPDGRVYQVWLLGEDESPSPTDALFVPGRDGTASVDVPGDVEGARQVLVTAEPRGGSDRPTRQPVVMASPRPA